MLFQMARGLRYFLCVAIETNNFAFDVKVILSLESTIPDGVGSGRTGFS